MFCRNCRHRSGVVAGDVAKALLIKNWKVLLVLWLPSVGKRLSKIRRMESLTHSDVQYKFHFVTIHTNTVRRFDVISSFAFWHVSLRCRCRSPLYELSSWRIRSTPSRYNQQHPRACSADVRKESYVRLVYTCLQYSGSGQRGSAESIDSSQRLKRMLEQNSDSQIAATANHKVATADVASGYTACSMRFQYQLQA